MHTKWNIMYATSYWSWVSCELKAEEIKRCTYAISFMIGKHTNSQPTRHTSDDANGCAPSFLFIAYMYTVYIQHTRLSTYVHTYIFIYENLLRVADRTTHSPQLRAKDMRKSTFIARSVISINRVRVKKVFEENNMILCCIYAFLCV